MSRFATPLSVLALAGASIALVACGSSSSAGSSAGAGTATTTTGQAGARGAAFQKYQACLKDNGVTLPGRGQGGPGAGGGGYGPPGGGQPPTGTNAGPPPGVAPGAADGAKFQKAMKACAKLRPQGLGNGRGGPGGANGARAQQNIKAFTPYLTCLKDQGLAVKVSDGFNALRGLKQDDPKVQAAFKACQSKLPQRPTATTTTGTT
jgi:hypothetical protein